MQKSLIYLLFLILFLSNTIILSTSKNIILIYINCLNKNRLGVYQNKNSPTKNIDKFSDNSFVFNRFFSSYTYTAPCIYELLTSKKCNSRYPLWKADMLKNIAFKDLKEYSLYFPYSIFGESIFKDINYKEPFIIFEHLSDLHTPYDTEFKYNGFYNIAGKIKNIEKFMPGNIFPFYRILFGIPFKIYKKDILNWNKFYNDLIKYKILKKFNKNKIKLKYKNIILKELNFKISLKSDIFKFLIYKNNNLYIGNKILKEENNNKFLNSVFYNFKYNFLDNNFLNIDENGNLKIIDIELLTNYYKYKLKELYFSILSIIDPDIKTIFENRIKFLKAKTLQEQLQEILLKFNIDISKFINKYNKSMIQSFYDNDLFKVDRKIKYKLELLKNKGLLKNTIIIIMGDHGEALGEHNYYGHGDDIMYNEVINTALIIKFPDQNYKKIINNNIRIIDIKPTIYDMLGFSKILKDSDGKSFFNIFYKNNRKKELDVFSKGSNYGYSLIQNNWKMIYNSKYEKIELYDLKNDPNEINDLIYDNMNIRIEIEEKLMNYIYGKK